MLHMAGLRLKWSLRSDDHQRAWISQLHEGEDGKLTHNTRPEKKSALEDERH